MALMVSWGLSYKSTFCGVFCAAVMKSDAFAAVPSEMVVPPE